MKRWNNLVHWRSTKTPPYLNREGLLASLCRYSPVPYKNNNNNNSRIRSASFQAFLSERGGLEKLTAMAMRVAARYASRRLFSSGSGKVLSEEEKAAENAYFKKAEQEKLEKLARKGPQPEAEPAAGSGGSVPDAKPSGSSYTDTSAEKVSTDKHRNYAVVAGTITILGALGWYLKGTAKKPEVQD